ncbi:hypothetical protein, partial [Salmonella enterica]|uniref:hypothetical protein n=1 Tax=Salmonella enterica TaxID=28901 RepID=UPI003F4C90B5
IALLQTPPLAVDELRVVKAANTIRVRAQKVHLSLQLGRICPKIVAFTKSDKLTTRFAQRHAEIVASARKAIDSDHVAPTPDKNPDAFRVPPLIIQA